MHTADDAAARPLRRSSDAAAGNGLGRLAMSACLHRLHAAATVAIAMTLPIRPRPVIWNITL